MVELAWLWTRYQPGAAQVRWFRERVGSAGQRARKIMVVAHARNRYGGSSSTVWCPKVQSVSLLPTAPAVRSALRTRNSPPIRGNVAVVRHGATAPFTQSGAVLLELSRPECGTVVGINSRRM